MNTDDHLAKLLIIYIYIYSWLYIYIYNLIKQLQYCLHNIPAWHLPQIHSEEASATKVRSAPPKLIARRPLARLALWPSKSQFATVQWMLKYAEQLRLYITVWTLEVWKCRFSEPQRGYQMILNWRVTAVMLSATWCTTGINCLTVEPSQQMIGRSFGLGDFHRINGFLHFYFPSFLLLALHVGCQYDPISVENTMSRLFFVREVRRNREVRQIMAVAVAVLEQSHLSISMHPSEGDEWWTNMTLNYEDSILKKTLGEEMVKFFTALYYQVGQLSADSKHASFAEAVGSWRPWNSGKLKSLHKHRAH